MKASNSRRQAGVAKSGWLVALLLLGGGFVKPDLARAADGELDPSFGSGGIAQPPGVWVTLPYTSAGLAMIRQSDGKLVRAGGGDVSDGRTFRIVRYNSSGSLDTTFGGTGKVMTRFTNVSFGEGNYATANALVQQTDGKLVAAGFAGKSGDADLALARYNTDGTVDATFGSTGQRTTHLGSGNDIVNAMVLQSDGKIVVAGSTTSGASSAICLARYDAAGNLDASFGNGGIVIKPIGVQAAANAIVLQPDGKLIIAGSADANLVLARYTTDGALDATFGVAGVVVTSIGSGAVANAVVLQSDGKVVAAGYALDPAAPDHPEMMAVARYHANGALDSSFGSAGIVASRLGYRDVLNAVQQRADGTLLIAGKTVASSTATSDFVVARLTSAGALDPSFGSGGKVVTSLGINDGADDLLVQPDGTTVASGTTSPGSGWGMARYTAGGVLDTTFGSSGRVSTTVETPEDFIQSMVQQNDSKIVALTRTFVMRFTADGALDPTFGTAGKRQIYPTPRFTDKDSIIQQSDGKLVVAENGADGGGAPTAVDTVRLRRFTATGANDSTFGTGGQVTLKADDYVFFSRVLQQPDGKLVLAICQLSEVPSLLARFNTNGSLDTTFGDAGLVRIADLRIGAAIGLPNGKLLLSSGNFDSGPNIQRLNADGTLDTSFGIGGRVVVESAETALVPVQTMILQADGKPVVLGWKLLSAYDESQMAAFWLMRFTADGAIDASFDSVGVVTIPAAYDNRATISAVQQSDGKIVVAAGLRHGGAFKDITLARYTTSGALDTSFGSGGFLVKSLSSWDDATSGLIVQPHRVVAGGYGLDPYGNQVPTLLGFAVAICGDGIVAGRESCDEGANNGQFGSCCSSACAPAAAVLPCRASAGPCDAVDYCTGTSSVCPSDLKSNAPCRPASDVCDVAESCDGLSDDCPADVKQSAGILCSDDGNPCTVDTCDGIASACQHTAGNAGAVCRASAGECDVPETCTGSSTSCPANIDPACTHTPTLTPTSTATPTPTSTATFTSTASSTPTSSSTSTATSLPTATSTLVPPSATPSPTPTATPFAGCPMSPRTDCDLPGRSTVIWKDSTNDAQDKVTVRFRDAVPPRALSDLADPTAGADYAICLYYDAALEVALVVAPGAPWQQRPRDRGYTFRDVSASQSGVSLLRVVAGRNGDARSSRADARGRGMALGDPIVPVPDVVTSVTVQLVTEARCWSDTYGKPFLANRSRSKGALFRLKR